MRFEFSLKKNEMITQKIGVNSPERLEEGFTMKSLHHSNPGQTLQVWRGPGRCLVLQQAQPPLLEDLQQFFRPEIILGVDVDHSGI